MGFITTAYLEFTSRSGRVLSLSALCTDRRTRLLLCCILMRSHIAFFRNLTKCLHCKWRKMVFWGKDLVLRCELEPCGLELSKQSHQHSILRKIWEYVILDWIGESCSMLWEAGVTCPCAHIELCLLVSLLHFFLLLAYSRTSCSPLEGSAGGPVPTYPSRNLPCKEVS
jgi:hypothetical protein